MDSYYILIDGVQTGPFTWYQLTEMDVDVDTMIMPAVSNKWIKASDIPEFYEYFETKGIYFPTTDNLASFGSRLLAFVIDCIAIYILINIIAIITVNALNIDVTKINIDSFKTLDATTRLLINVAVFILFTIYNTLFEISPTQGSIGKRICKIIVVDADGRRLGFVNALLRNLYKFISQAVLYIGYLNILWDEHRQGWHDQWARTYLIKRDR